MVPVRDVAHIWEAWTSTEPKVGELRPCSRVTVEKSFRLRLSGTENTVSTTVGNWNRGPARWFQRADTARQVETEVPNVTSVSIDRSMDSDAATCEISIANTKNLAWGELEETPGQLGRPGYYTWSRGSSQEAVARWGHAPNEWRDVLVPNALLRTYQGYGGHDKAIVDAVTDGNLVLTGVWLVDEVRAGGQGALSLRCRDMGKLLVDQQLFPPLVPVSQYPLLYQRYTYDSFVIPPDPPPSVSHEIVSQSVGSPDGLGDYRDGPGFTVRASSDPAGVNQVVFGHRPGDAFDMTYGPPDGQGNFAHQYTYWLSDGYGTAIGGDAYPWVECNAHHSEVNLVYLHTWAGNSLVYVSVWEAGAWAPPEDGQQGGIVPSTDPAAAVPYVASVGSQWDGNPPGSNQYQLPRTYLADKVRLTFTNLADSQEGGFRAGAKKIMPQLDKTLAHYPALSFACCPHPSTAGYWQARSNGRVWAFGDARRYSANGNSAATEHDSWVVAVNATPDAGGYWTLSLSGRLVSYGNAGWYGDLDGQRFDTVDFAPTPSGHGYYLLCTDGSVHCYGDAVSYGNATVSGTMPSGARVKAQSIESHPVTQGYWVLLSDGTVSAHNLTSYGNANRAGFGVTEYVHALRRNKTGSGYWVLSGSGIMQHFGAAGDFGNGTRYPAEDWVNGLCWDFIPEHEAGAGYYVQHANGKLDGCGTFESFGSIGEGGGMLRKAGNYKDYSDIVKELLLWSGFYLYRSPQPGRAPDVYGNIETTGAFAKEDLPADMFDKRAVMDAVTQLKEIVGYVFYVDDEGGARFEAPNWWSMGNYDYTGTALDIMPEVDEAVQLTDYSIQFHDAEARSEIIIASENPYPTVHGQPGPSGTIVTRIVPPSAADLKGLVKPAMWTNGVFTNAKEQKTMADLIAMHIWFARRTGELTCVANPLIGINDQARIYERQTGETFVHFIRGVRTQHDLESGEYTMSLTTHWLGGSPWNTAPWYFTGAARPQGDGYWEASSAADVFAFGAAQLYPKNEPATHVETVVSMRSSVTGDGYYTLDVSGKVVTHGDATHHGDLFDQDNTVKDFAVTSTGGGYHILHGNGTVAHFGDAVDHGNATVAGTMPSGSPVMAESIETAPGGGYWVLLSDGTVSAHGTTWHGNANRSGFTTTEYVSCLRSTTAGDGYYVVSGSGKVQAFGAAVDYGDATLRHVNPFLDLVWDMMPVNGGYALQHADGKLDPLGAFADHGSVVPAQAKKTWALSTDTDTPAAGGATAGQTLAVSTDVIDALKRMESKATMNAAVGHFDDEAVTTQKART